MKKIVGLGVAGLLLSGCISQTVNSVKGLNDEEICVITNLSVRKDFETAYVQGFTDNGYRVSVKETPADAKDCAITATYSARYGFHWGEYLAVADLRMYRGEQQIGSVYYKAPFASPAKHGRIAPKIKEMVNQMLPRKAG